MQVHTHSTLTKHTCMWKTSLDVNRLQLFFPNSWLCMMKSRWSLKHRWGKHYNRTQIIWSSHESWVVFNGWCSHPRNFLGKVLLCIFTMGILLIWFLLFLVTTPPPSPPPQADEIYLSSPRQGPGSLQTLKRWGKLPNATGILFPKGRDGLEINLESVSLPEGRGPKLRVYI